MENKNILIAFEKVQKLISDFESGILHYLSANYQEAEVRQEYIDKFFTALGWDVNHDIQKNPFEQEVKIEKAQRQQGELGQKRADYAFFLEPEYKKVQFFVEAKKPSRTLRQNKDDYFQTAKYGWNAGTGISILTDFEEIVIIDCRFVPDIETVLQTQIKYYRYTDFKKFETFEEFYWIFSREALVAGNLPKFIDQLPKPKGSSKQLKLFGGKYQSIDETFLKYIDEKRFELAIAFNQNYPNFDDYTLTNITQRTIDRIIFIRFLEDKGIENEQIINSIATSQHPWQKFIAYCNILNTKYNSKIFKPSSLDKKDFIGPNQDLFRNLCSEMDNTNSPYDFNYIPIYILGSIYERFLGKIVVIENGKASIEEKPEVRKAGGVFYTPKYIVDYIVENTIGTILKNDSNSMKPAEIAKLSFADISCGSGSFLIGAYEYLLDYHQKYYNNNPTDAQNDGCDFIPEDGIYKLTIIQKQQILCNNIYGVDIDFLAVEVTQLSLFLKMLEDETMNSVHEMKLKHNLKVLPDLDKNIIGGNSLIGRDILDYKLDLDMREERKLNAFDFKYGFVNIFKNGGFDAIIGNPPYVRNSGLDKISSDYFKLNYKLSKGQFDLYEIFIEKAIFLLKNNGYLGYITPRFFQFNIDSLETRKLLIKNNLIKLIEVGKVFNDASTECSVFILNKKEAFKSKIDVYSYFPNEKLEFINLQNETFYKKLPNFTFNTFLSVNELNIIQKIKTDSVLLENISNIKRGIEIGKSEIKKNISGSKILLGFDVTKYETNYTETFLEINESNNNKFEIFINSEKLLIRRVANSLISAYDSENGYWFNKNLYGLTTTKIEIKFLLGLINSDLINFYLKKFYTTKKEDLFPEIQSYMIKGLPIKVINDSNNEIKHKIILRVNQILKSFNQLKLTIDNQDKIYFEDKINAYKNQINELVYELYGLNEDEIEIIKQSVVKI